jgi:hypothetical protein
MTTGMFNVRALDAATAGCMPRREADHGGAV